MHGYNSSAPFPHHVLRFLHGGKVITLVDKRGARLDFQSDRYRAILSSIDEKFRREHFSCARLAQDLSPKPQRKTKRVPTVKEAVGEVEATPTRCEEVLEEDLESISEETLLGHRPQPSNQLLRFLGFSDSRPPLSPKALRKSQSLCCSPKVSPNVSQLYFKPKRRVALFPKPTITRRCLGVSEDRRLGSFLPASDSKKSRLYDHL